jgi:hypothetical protein
VCKIVDSPCLPEAEAIFAIKYVSSLGLPWSLAASLRLTCQCERYRRARRTEGRLGWTPFRLFRGRDADCSF